jgi:hypothetical protein
MWYAGSERVGPVKVKAIGVESGGDFKGRVLCEVTQASAGRIYPVGHQFFPDVRDLYHSFSWDRDSISGRGTYRGPVDLATLPILPDPWPKRSSATNLSR